VCNGTLLQYNLVFRRAKTSRQLTRGVNLRNRRKTVKLQRFCKKQSVMLDLSHSVERRKERKGQMTRKQDNAKKTNWKGLMGEQEDFLRPIIREVL
jgi:hypothetical protein